MRAAQVMTTDILSIAFDATIFDAAEILVGTGVSALPVVDGRGCMIGILSEADLIRRCEIGTEPRKSWFHRLLADDAAAAKEYVAMHSRRVTDVMSKPVVTVQEGDTLGRIADVMVEHKVKRVPVLSGDRVVGIVSRSNLLKALLSRDPQGGKSAVSDEEIRRNVETVLAKQPWTSPWPTNILVNAGVVHLWGFVQSDASAEAYRVAAENVPGVTKVRNHLRRLPASVGMGL